MLDTGDIIINDIRSTTEIESFESAGHAGQIFIQNTNGNIIEDEGEIIVQFYSCLYPHSVQLISVCPEFLFSTGRKVVVKVTR